jgi:hypothetical protein
METIALVLFAVAALIGLFLAVRHFRGQPLPLPVAFLHGVAAASGLVLVAAAFLEGAQALRLALILLVVAALGGFFLLSFHLRGKPLPSPVVVLHALLAVSGVVALLLVVL